MIYLDFLGLVVAELREGAVLVLAFGGIIAERMGLKSESDHDAIATLYFLLAPANPWEFSR